jgi:hypothetical protein
MSSIANLSSAPSAVPPGNLHLHGHKKGSHVGSTDDSSGDTAQMPVGAAQNLFSKMLQSLEQVIGVQLTAATPAATPTAAPAVTAATAAGVPDAPGTTAAATSTAAAVTASIQSKGTLLRNYLNNLSQNLPANGAQPAKFAGANVSVNA